MTHILHFAEEIARTLHMGSYNSSQQQVVSRPRLARAYDGYDLEMDGVEITSPGNNMAADPFAIYESARNRLERPSLPPPPLVGHGDNGEKLFERRQRNMVATSNLPDSLRARLLATNPIAVSPMASMQMRMVADIKLQLVCHR